MTETLVQRLAAEADLLGLSATVLVYAGCAALHRRLGAPVCTHPLLLAIGIVVLALWLTGLPFEAYFASAQLLHLALGPVMVLLAVPLARHAGRIARIGPRLVPLLVGTAAIGVATSAGVAAALGTSDRLVAALAPRSVTTPVALSLSEHLGGVPAITALAVILTGLVGAAIGWQMLGALGLRDPRVRGFAIGVGAHVIGTTRVLQIDEVAGAFASFGMVLNAVATAVLLIVLEAVLRAS